MKKVLYMLGLGALLANFALAQELPKVEKKREAATGENCAMKPTAEEQEACMKAQRGEKGEGIAAPTGGAGGAPTTSVPSAPQAQ